MDIELFTFLFAVTISIFIAFFIVLHLIRASRITEYVITCGWNTIRRRIWTDRCNTSHL